MAPKKAARKHPKKNALTEAEAMNHPILSRLVLSFCFFPLQSLVIRMTMLATKSASYRWISMLYLTINQITRISQNICAMYVFDVHYVYDYIESWNILHFLWFTDPFHYRVTAINLWTHTPKCLTSEQLGEQTNKQRNKQTKNNAKQSICNLGR